MHDAVRPHQPLQPRDVVARRLEDQARAADGIGRRGVTERPRAGRALLGVRSLGDDVGNAERLAYRGPEPVRRLVVDVIGEPEVGTQVRRTVAPPRGEPLRERLALAAQRLLALEVAV